MIALTEKYKMIRNALALTVLALGSVACMQAPDLSAVQAERVKAVQRYDITQSVAANGSVLVAGTQDGVMLISRDKGKTWERKLLGPVSMIGLASCPDGTFVGIDFNHKVWAGSIDGATWKGLALDKPRVPLAVTCDGKGQWWVAGSGAKIAMSGDKGSSWRVTDLNEDIQITTVQLVDDSFGIAMGEFGTVITTHDGGATWQKGAKIANDFYPYAAVFADRNEGWASGIAGQILQTRDGGTTWTKQENATQASLYRLFLLGGKPYGVGAGGMIARLEGDTFRSVPYPDAVPVFLGAGSALPGDQNIAIGGPGGLVRVLVMSHD